MMTTFKHIGQLVWIVAVAASTQLVQAAEPVQTPRPARSAQLERLERQVADTERAFAKTMADRDQTAFATFLAEEAVFFSGPTTTLRGKQQVIEGWKRFYEKPDAPFSWQPAQVEVLDSGTLALSTGPVLNPAGKQVGTFTSIWRLEASGAWRVIFDKGCDVCERCDKP